MALEGKISVKHFLNKKLQPVNGKFPLYVLIRFKNREAKIKSRLNDLFGIESDFELINNTITTRRNFGYFNENDLAKYRSLVHTEATMIIALGELMKKDNVNIIESEPSRVIDITFKTVGSIITSQYKNLLTEKLISLKYLHSASVYSKSENDFSYLIKSLAEIGNSSVEKFILKEFDRETKVFSSLIKYAHLSTSKKSVLLIDWLTNDVLRMNILRDIEKACGEAFANDFLDTLQKEVNYHLQPLRLTLPKNF